MFERILLPTEAASESDPVIDLANDLAERWGADLCILYVIQDTEGAIAEVDVDERRGRLTAEQENAIEVVEDKTRGLAGAVTTTIGTGEPEHSIPRHIERLSADFVVMGTHSRTGVKRLLAGNTAEKVVRRADVPVLVVPLDDQA